MMIETEQNTTSGWPANNKTANEHTGNIQFNLNVCFKIFFLSIIENTKLRRQNDQPKKNEFNRDVSLDGS